MEFLDKDKKKKGVIVPLEPTPLTTSELEAKDVKTGIVKKIIIIQNPMNDEVIHQLINKNIVMFSRKGSIITIKQKNDNPIVLSFKSKSEAELGELRIISIMNGENLL